MKDEKKEIGMDGVYIKIDQLEEKYQFILIFLLTIKLSLDIDLLQLVSSC